jgi:hypothetical protein
MVTLGHDFAISFAAFSYAGLYVELKKFDK